MLPINCQNVVRIVQWIRRYTRTRWSHFLNCQKKAIEDNRLRPRIRNALRPSTAKLRCVRRALWSSYPVCDASRWLTSFGRWPCRTSRLPYYVKACRHSQHRRYITYCVVVRGGPSNGKDNTENLVKFGHAIFDIRELTVRHTDTPITILRTRLSAFSRSHFLIDFCQNWHRGNNPQK